MVEANATNVAGIPDFGSGDDVQMEQPRAPAMQNRRNSGEESKLARKEHWDATFQMELENFENNGDDGEVWFGKDVQKKTVAYILDQYCNENAQAESLTLLDVGTGNGALLFKLTKKGICQRVQNVTLKGIDYSEHSVVFAQRVRDSLAAREEIEERMRADYAKIVIEHQDAFQHVEEGQYDII